MDRQIIMPTDRAAWLRERTRDVTSTEISALYDCSPYMTRFELWHQKRDAVVVEIEDNERMRWGRRLQDAIAQGVCEDRGWVGRQMPEYIRDESARMGSSFDWRIFHTPLDELLEIKNVDALMYTRGAWTIEAGELLEAPDHIELQLQYQLEVSDLARGHIAPLVGGNTCKLLTRGRDHALGAAFRATVAEFWRSVDANEPPAPDFRKDAAFIAQLYGYASPGKLYDGRGNAHLADLATRYTELRRIAKDADDDSAAIKAELLTIIGDAEKVIGDNFKVSAGVVAPAEISYTRAAYRNFRLTQGKPK